MDDYIAEFNRLVARVDIAELDNQLALQYIRGIGMRQKFQDSFNFFDPVNASEAHQRALPLGKTLLGGH
jgi:hypothetical protein